MTRRDRPDPALVAAARDGDRRAFAALVERHYGVLLATCRRATGNAEVAADAAQEAVVTALVGLDRLRDPDRFGAWLIGIGLNLCRRAMQERARWARADGHEPPAPGPGPPEAAEDARLVRAAVAALPPGQRMAVTLYYLAGLSQAETAARAGTSVGAVKVRLHKARARLREQLGPWWKEEQMPDEPAGWVEMRVTDVRWAPVTDEVPERHVVLLEEIGGERRLPIWIGMPEALSLVAALEEVELPRPGPYHFAQALLAAAGGALREVRVSRLADSVFYAVAVLADGSEVDARPSDALTLALVTGAPITVEPAVLDASEHFARERPGLAAEVSGPADSASVLADEVRARLAELARDVAELNEPPAEP